jgi:hypothetical protein
LVTTTLESTASPVGSVPQPSALAFGCTAAFVVPFALAGTAAAGIGARRLLEGNWHDGLLLSLFGVVFGGFALVFWFALWAGRRKLQEESALRARHPEQPWLWRPDWASGSIADTGRATLWTAWVIAVLWNLVAIPSGYLGIRAAFEQNNPAAYIVLMFPAIGAGLLVWAVRATLRYRKYQVSRLELSTIPGVVGHSLSGTVRVNAIIDSPESFVAALSCVRRVTSGSGKSRSTTETILWQDEEPVAGRTSRGAGGWETQVPIAFRVPPDAEPCRLGNPNDQTLWRLTLRASVPGVDYASTFEVPVFRTDATPSPATQAETQLAERESQEVLNYHQPVSSRIRVSRYQQDLVVLFPPARNPGAAAGATLFALLWGAVAWALIHYKAPLVFPVVFGLTELLVIWISLRMWLGVSRVTARPGTLLLASGLGYPYRQRTLPASAIADITVAIGMQAGSVPYYDVVVRQKDGTKVTAGSSVREKREAEWLAVTLKGALGLPATPPN